MNANLDNLADHHTCVARPRRSMGEQGIPANGNGLGQKRDQNVKGTLAKVGEAIGVCYFIS